MSPTWEADKLVTVRSEHRGRYTRSFLKHVVCEFRFPTLLELGDSPPPSSFASALRKAYPILQRQNELTLAVGGGPNGTSHSHVFRSARQDSMVTLKPSSFSVETLAYRGFQELKAEALRVLAVAQKIIDTDYFTRVGLRYVNVLNVGERDVNLWLNTELIGKALDQNRFRGVQAFSGALQLGAPDGGCLLQHNAHPSKKSDESPVLLDYLLDIDVWRNILPLDDVPAALDALHEQAFDLFDWTIGSEARDFLLGRV